MANKLNEEFEQAVLSTIKHGRWLAQDWEESDIVPGENLRPLITRLIQRLQSGEPFDVHDDTAIALMAEEITEALNALKPGYGDLAMRIDTSEHLIFDKNRERVRKLAESWKSFQSLRTHVGDLKTAIRQIDLALRKG